MSVNEKFRAGNKVSVPVPAGTKAGAPLRLGKLNAVAATDRAKTDVSPTNDDGTVNASYNAGGGNPNGNASVWFDGGHEFQVTFAVTGIGDEIYIDGNNALQSSATNNFLFGHALTVKGSTAGPLTVRIAN